MTRTTLAALGYEVRFRHLEWVECALLGPGESALGRGPDEDGALADALRQLLPSHLAQQLWLQRLLAEEQDSRETRLPALARVPEPEPGPEPETEGSARSCRPEVAQESPLRLSQPEPGPETEGSARSCRPEVAQESPLRLSQPEPGPKPEPVRPIKHIDLTHVLDDLDDLQDEMDAADDLGVFAPKFLRFQLLAWAARARDWQDRYPSPEVEVRCSGVIRRVTLLSKVLWPGQIHALRREATPQAAAELLAGHDFRDWAEVAEAAQAAMRPAPGQDEYGWSDGDLIGPPPADWPGRLGEVKKILTSLVPDVQRPDTPGANELARRIPPLVATKAVADMASKLRWLRPFADPEQWGALMGLVRWLIDQTGLRSNDAVCNLVRGEHRPARTWAEECGVDLRRAEKKAMWAELPAVQGSLEAFAEWFAEAARLLEAPELAPRLAPLLDLMQAADPQRLFPGKSNGRTRDRWRAVVKRLKVGESSGAEAAAPVDPEADDEPVAPLPQHAPIVEQARQLVAGKLALLVSNRADPELEQQLSRTFALDIESVDVDRNAFLHAAAERIASGRYDLVLCLTGFVSHKHEQVIRDAARKSACPVVRADKGRRLAAARAIVRDLATSR